MRTSWSLLLVGALLVPAVATAQVPTEQQQRADRHDEIESRDATARADHAYTLAHRQQVARATVAGDRQDRKATDDARIARDKQASAARFQSRDQAARSEVADQRLHDAPHN